MLGEIARGGEIPADFRNVIREYKSLAEIYKTETEKMLKSLESRLEPRYYLSLRIIFDLYLKIYERIDPENGSFSAEELNPTPDEVKKSVSECITRFKNHTRNDLQFTIYSLRS